MSSGLSASHGDMMLTGTVESRVWKPKLERLQRALLLFRRSPHWRKEALGLGLGPRCFHPTNYEQGARRIKDLQAKAVGPWPFRLQAFKKKGRSISSDSRKYEHTGPEVPRNLPLSKKHIIYEDPYSAPKTRVQTSCAKHVFSHLRHDKTAWNTARTSPKP